jgi:hypothetical protein
MDASNQWSLLGPGKRRAQSIGHSDVIHPDVSSPYRKRCLRRYEHLGWIQALADHILIASATPRREESPSLNAPQQGWALRPPVEKRPRKLS